MELARATEDVGDAALPVPLEIEVVLRPMRLGHEHGDGKADDVRGLATE